MRIFNDFDPRHDALGDGYHVAADRKSDDLNLAAESGNFVSGGDLERLAREPWDLDEREVAAMVHGTDHGV